MGRSRITDKRICFNCGLSQTYTNQWYKHNEKHYCKKCNNKLYNNPKWHSITRNWVTSFKGKSRYIGFRPKREVCSRCGMKKGEKYTIWGEQKTVKIDLHHIQYHEDDPLKDTIELCGRCHIYESIDNNERWGRPPRK
jgi:ribosomal protein S27AE